MSIDIEAPADSDCHVTITDITGRMIKAFNNEKIVHKKLLIKWNTDGLARGAYLIKIKTNANNSIDKKLILE